MKKIVFFSFIISLFYSAESQDNLGFLNSNYSGITGVQLNPANVVNGRMRFDMTLFGLNLNVANNYIGLRQSALEHEGSYPSAIKKAMKGEDAFPAFYEDDFKKKYLNDVNNGRDKALFASVRVTLPSFLINLNNKNAIGFSMNARSITNMDGVSNDLAKLIYADIGRDAAYNVNDVLGKQLNNKNLSINTMLWLEYGFTFGHVFKDDNEHFFKGAATLKLLQGLASAYVNIKNLEYKFENNPLFPNTDSLQILSVFKTDINYGHSTNLEFPSPNAPDKKTNPFLNNPTLYTTLGSGLPKFESFPGTGLDLGFVYEWRPDYADYKYDMDGETGLWRRDKNKYKLKAGFSILDIGNIRYVKGKYSNNFSLDLDSILYRTMNFKDYPVYDFDRIIDSLGEYKNVKGSYKMALPTVISAQIDYNIWKDFYVNLTPFIALQRKNREAKVHEVTNISLAPRWDHKWFGVSLPISYNSFAAKANQPIRLGTMLRVGPLILGTNNLGPYFGKKDIFGADFYFMLKVPIPYGAPKDKDKDKVSDRKDKCKTVPGVWEFMGCPDRDGDHIQDSEDKCPDVPGVKELQGCPDRDGDGITDSEDACPDDKGPVEFKGCPDRDGDKIIDKDDECPDEPGLAEFMGCPDKDGDGTPDKLDVCPDMPGPKEYKGCPDKDGDTVLDKDDACPDVAGPVENKGCPWPDSDMDGIVDKDDACPTIAGTAEYKGCPPPPPMKPAEEKILERAFSSLEFATAKDIIKPVSFASLNDLAKLMVEHNNDWKLLLSGHTDNDGDPDKNMLLSEKRSKAVMKYLVKKGVKAENIIVEWYGQTKPIADNSTKEGKQKNRRVEMKVQFKQKQ